MSTVNPPPNAYSRTEPQAGYSMQPSSQPYAQQFQHAPSGDPQTGDGGGGLNSSYYQGDWNTPLDRRQKFFHPWGPSPPYSNQDPEKGHQHPQYQQPHPQGNPTHPQAQSHPQTVNKPTWNDLPFLLLFVLHFVGFVVISAFGLREIVHDGLKGGLGSGGRGIEGSGGTVNLHTAYLLALVSAVALVLALLLLWFVKKFTKIVLEATLALSVVVSVAYAIYLWVEKFTSGAIVFTIFAIISIIAYFPMRKRIPLSKLLLRFVIRIADEYKSTYVIAIISTVILAFYSVWWSFTVTGVYTKYSPSSSHCQSRSPTNVNSSVTNCDNATMIGLMVYLVFSFYWTTQVITNVTLTALAGIFGTYYFAGPHSSASSPYNLPPPRHVALGSLKRALTYSFGSVAEGSLIVALLDLLRAGLNVLRQQEAQSGDLVGAACACVAGCCVGCLRWFVEWFNRYAYIEIALYGKKYIQAATDAWRLIKDRGVDALINDCLVNNIWTFGSYAIGAICSFFAYIYLHQTRPQYITESPGLYAVIVGYSFIIGFFIPYSLGYGCISSGVSTIFIGLAEAPGVLATRDPALFEMIRQKYPRVVRSVQHDNY